MSASDTAFENEVRRIARLLWPTGEYGGAAMEDGRERDGIFITEEFVHLIECTTSRSKQKAIEDHEKLDKLSRKLAARYPEKFVKGWFVTQQEPTADQREVFRKGKGRQIPISFEQFRSKLVDAYTYLSARDLYPFGSLRDPETEPSPTKSNTFLWISRMSAPRCYPSPDYDRTNRAGRFSSRRSRSARSVAFESAMSVQALSGPS